MARCSLSCPNLVPKSRTRLRSPLRSHSPPSTRPVSYEVTSSKKVLPSLFSRYSLCTSGPLRPSSSRMESARLYSKSCDCGCPCPFPCGPCGNGYGCGCLPPPCNTPPRCIQYMTGYYYYPYGVWFCGPYHVSGTCKSIGPCSPGGPCGPCNSCSPCGPCGPCCVCPTPESVVSASDQPKPCSSLSSPLPGNRVETPLPCPQSQSQPQPAPRSGLSKYFPFNTTVAPNIYNEPQNSRYRLQGPPSSFNPCVISPFNKQRFSTQAAGCQVNRRNIDVRSKCFDPKTLRSNKLSARSFHIDSYSKMRISARYKPSVKRYMYKAFPQLDQPKVYAFRGQRGRDFSTDSPQASIYSAVPCCNKPVDHPFEDTIFKPYES